jgi:SagB-type dehydrogenase family enzyme
MRTALIIVCALLAGSPAVLSQSAATEGVGRVALPAPVTKGGMPLMDALDARSSTREYSQRDLPPQVLSDLLWAAFGINRPESGKRTAPSARNWQEIDVYVATADGLYRYLPAAHALEAVLDEDIRAATGRQPFAGIAPLNLVFVADFTKMGDATERIKEMYAAADAGFISQNVYLYCASQGLGTVVRGSVDREALAMKMRLRENQRIVFAQTIGYPPERE